MSVGAAILACSLAYAIAADAGGIADTLLALTFLNHGTIGLPSDNLTLLTQCAGFSEDTVQVR